MSPYNVAFGDLPILIDEGLQPRVDILHELRVSLALGPHLGLPLSLAPEPLMVIEDTPRVALGHGRGCQSVRQVVKVRRGRISALKTGYGAITADTILVIVLVISCIVSSCSLPTLDIDLAPSLIPLEPQSPI